MRERASARGGLHATRRGVLAVAGAAAFAGCGAIRSALGPDPPEVEAAALSEIASGQTPPVAGPLPVDVADAHVAASRSRARSALETVPLPLSVGELPNGVIREELHDTAEHAREALSKASAAPGTHGRLDRLRRGRDHARAVAASWAFVNDELTPGDVRDRAGTVRGETRTYRGGWTYAGRDVVRALLVHAVVESWTRAAWRYVDRTDDGPRERTNALTVGERAGSVERGRAYLDDARHVGERFLVSLSERESVRPALTSARESLTATVRTRRRDLPPGGVDDPAELVDANVGEGPAARALDELHWRLPEVDALGRADGLAGDVVERFGDLAEIRAFASVRDRVANGERFAVESAADLRARRQSVVEAIETALAASADRRLARHALSNVRRRLDGVDRELGQYEGTVPATHLDDEVGRYVALAATARAVPDACAETLAALEVA